jgi:hypothetical protein
MLQSNQLREKNRWFARHASFSSTGIHDHSGENDPCPRFTPLAAVAWLGIAFFSLATVHAQEKAAKPDDGTTPGRPLVVPVERAEDGRQFRFMGFSPDGNTLVYSSTGTQGSQAPVLVFFDLKQRKKIKSLSGPDPFKAPISALFLPGRKQLIVAYYGDRKPFLLDWHTEKIRTFECGESEHSPLNPMVLTPKGDYLVSFGSGIAPGSPLEIHVWEVATAKKVARFGGERGQHISRICLAEDGKYVVAEHAKVIKRGPGLDRNETVSFSVRAWDLLGGKDLGFVGTANVIMLRRGDPVPNMLNDVCGSAARCRVRISPSGKIMVVPVVPRDTVLEVVLAKGRVLAVRELATGKELGRFDEFSKGGADAYGFSPDQKTFAVSGGLMVGTSRTALFTWDVSAYRGKAIRFRPELSTEQMGELFSKFAQKDAGEAYRAMRQLAATPEQSLAFLKERLKPAPDRSGEIAGLLSQVAEAKAGSKAQHRLVEIGDEALPIMQRAIKNSTSPEMKKIMEGILATIIADNQLDAKTRQAIWTIELLEFMASAESLEFLKELAEGASAAWVAQEARASIKRMGSGN